MEQEQAGNGGEEAVSRHACVDAPFRQPAGQLIGDSADAGSGQAILAGREAPHDKLKQPRRGAQAPVKEDAAQERPEEAVYDGLRESLCLHVHSRCQ